MTSATFPTDFDQHVDRLLSHRKRQIHTIFQALYEQHAPIIKAAASQDERVLVSFAGFLHGIKDLGPGKVAGELGPLDVLVTTNQLLLFGILGLGRANHQLAQNVLLANVPRVSGSEARGSLRKRFFVIRIEQGLSEPPLLISPEDLASGPTVLKTLSAAVHARRQA